MSYANEDIVRSLKVAREAKGLSQRDLGARIGVPQGHISKIESGRTDIRLSSLIEIARALDLELTLVPRKALPAVEAMVRRISPSQATPPIIDAAKAVRGLDRTLKTLDRCQALFPEQEGWRSLKDSLHSLKALLQSPEGGFMSLSGEIRKAYEPIHKKLAKVLKSPETMKILPPEILPSLAQALTQATATIRQRYNRIARGESVSREPRPAYRLDEDEEDNHG